MSETQSRNADPDRGQSAKRTPGSFIAIFCKHWRRLLGTFIRLLNAPQRSDGDFSLYVQPHALSFSKSCRQWTQAVLSWEVRIFFRRGIPSVIWSDNGTNFVAAEKEFLQNILKWNNKSFAESMV